MSGVSVTIEVKDQAARAAFAELARVMGDTSGVMAAIGAGLVANTHTRFEEERSPDGASWAPLNSAYASTKRGAGILRESAMRGGLMGSITHSAGPSSVEIGSNKVYAAIHQLGGTITPKNASHLTFRLGGAWVRASSVTIPARPYLGIGPEDEATILEVLAGALGRAIDRGAATPSP